MSKQNPVVGETYMDGDVSVHVDSIEVTEDKWECPNCHSMVDGSNRTCPNCAGHSTSETPFIRTDRVVTDSAKIQEALSGDADKMCPSCGTRNKAEATNCTQCGSPFDGAKSLHKVLYTSVYNSTSERDVQASEILTSHRYTEQGRIDPIERPVYKSPPPIGAIVGIGAVIVALCALVWFLIPHPITTTVTDMVWTRVQGVEQYNKHTGSGTGVPAGATEIEHHWDVVGHHQEFDHTEYYQVDHTRTVPNGSHTVSSSYDCSSSSSNGKGQTVTVHKTCTRTSTVQDYRTEHYTTTESRPVYRTVADYGNLYSYWWMQYDWHHDITWTRHDKSPEWPTEQIPEGQRYSPKREETYTVTFTDGDKHYVWTTTYTDWLKYSLKDEVEIEVSVAGIISKVTMKNPHTPY